MSTKDDTGVVLRAGAPAGGAWKASATSLKCKRKTASPDGVTAIVLKEGLVPGKAKITLKGKGPLLDMPSTDTMATPVTVRLSRIGGPCWEAVYSTPFQTQTSGQFKDASD